MKTRKLSLCISKWCRSNGFDVAIRYGADFAYFYKNDIIRYSLMVGDEQDKMFKTVFENEGLKYNCDIFLLSLFHELGHYMTEDNWTCKQSNEFMAKKSKLDGSKVEDNFEYFYMPDEIMATRWAIEYINTHANEVKDFWKNIQKEIFNIYREMGYKC